MNEKTQIYKPNSLRERETQILESCAERPSVNNTANMMLIDVSESSSYEMGFGDSRKKIVCEKEATCAYVAKLPNTAWVGITIFGDFAKILCPMGELGNNKLRIIKLIQELRPFGSTPMKEAFKLSTDEFKKVPPHLFKRAIIATDGVPDSDPTIEAEEMKRLGVQLHTIGFGSDYFDEDLLRSLASLSEKGTAFYSHFREAKDLTQYYKRESQIITK